MESLTIHFSRRATPAAEFRRSQTTMKYEDTIGKTVALVMMGKDTQGEDDWAVVKGVLERSGGDILFVHDGKPNRFPLPADALDRIKPTTSETRAILLDADLSLPLTIGPTAERTLGSKLPF